MKPKNKVNIKWSPPFAYAMGLLVTDGNLSPDGRHINFTSKDIELIKIFKKCLGIKNKISCKARGGEKDKKYFCVQFGDINFYNFLLKTGLTPNKSKTLGVINIPNKHFFDFLKGHFDGDGSFYSYWDPRWKSSYMFYTSFASASKKHIEWLQNKIIKSIKINGHITKDKKRITYQLKYAKKDSLKLLNKIYQPGNTIYLKRKYLKIKKALSIMPYK